MIRLLEKLACANQPLVELTQVNEIVISTTDDTKMPDGTAANEKVILCDDDCTIILVWTRREPTLVVLLGGPKI